ncbi:MAG: hypothetical protein OEZ68_03880 [Gammaproteobacteria bacterium]|nr:hypothetical protein [Gammaproteobacteria bacterium]MDH5799925.1 hypothetical protein [Gammaproteobacteria bacterium]
MSNRHPISVFFDYRGKICLHLGLLSLLALCGCDVNTQSSESLKDHEIIAEYSISSRHETPGASPLLISLDADLRYRKKGKNEMNWLLLKVDREPDETGYVDLSANESLIASDGVIQQSLYRDTYLFGSSRYDTQWISNQSGEIQYTITLHRANGNNLAANITIPATPVISSPASGQVFSVANDTIDVSWDSTADTYFLSISGTCIQYSTFVHNSNQLSIPPGALNFIGDQAECTATLRISAKVTGEIDSRMHSSSYLDGTSLAAQMAMGVTP